MQQCIMQRGKYVICHYDFCHAILVGESLSVYFEARDLAITNSERCELSYFYEVLMVRWGMNEIEYTPRSGPMMINSTNNGKLTPVRYRCKPMRDSAYNGRLTPVRYRCELMRYSANNERFAPVSFRSEQMSNARRLAPVSSICIVQWVNPIHKACAALIFPLGNTHFALYYRKQE